MDERRLLGQRIKELRRVRGLSQEQSAEWAEISPNYLSSLERGHENPALDLLVTLARALKVELVDVFNYSWLKRVGAHGRAPLQIKTMVEAADLERLREIFALMKAREA